jgi:hypothetical protein
MRSRTAVCACVYLSTGTSPLKEALQGFVRRAFQGALKEALQAAAKEALQGPVWRAFQFVRNPRVAGLSPRPNPSPQVGFGFGPRPDLWVDGSAFNARIRQTWIAVWGPIFEYGAP